MGSEEKQREQKGTVKEYRTILPFVAKYKWAYFFGILFLFITNIGQIIIPQYVQTAIDIIVDFVGTRNSFIMGELVKTLSYMLLLAFAVAIGRYFWRRLINGSARRIEKELREKLFNHLLTLSESYYDNTKTGDLMAHFTNDMNSVRMSIGIGLVALIDGVVITVVIFSMLISKYGVGILLIVSPLFLILILVLFMGPKMGARFKSVQEGFSNLTDRVQESFSGIRVIKSFARESYALGRVQKSSNEYRNAVMKLVVFMGVLWPATTLIAGLSSLVLFYIGGGRVLEGTLTAGEFVSLSMYLGMLVWPMLGVGFTVTLFQRGGASLKRINKILKAESPVKDPLFPIAPKDGKLGSLLVSNLTYFYPEQKKPTLEKIKFALPEGKILGITGHTGSGKTTLIKALTHSIPIANKSVYYSEIDMTAMSLNELHKRIGVVTQQPFLFSETIEENLLFAAKENGVERLDEIIELSALKNDIATFPEALQTEVGEKGVTLSGGQKQRITIGRLLLKEAEIAIFDDALSAVDAETEMLLLKGILKERKGKTTIFVSHRCSTLEIADDIIVLDQGKISQRGVHKDLIEKEGYYQMIYKMQQKSNK